MYMFLLMYHLLGDLSPAFRGQELYIRLVIAEILELSLLFYVPFRFVFSPAKGKFHRTPTRRVVGAVLTTWLLHMIYFMSVTHGILFEISHRENPFSLYDGTGNNSILLVFGWLDPLLIVLGMLLLKMMVMRRKSN